MLSAGSRGQGCKRKPAGRGRVFGNLRAPSDAGAITIPVNEDPGRFRYVLFTVTEGRLDIYRLGFDKPEPRCRENCYSSNEGVLPVSSPLDFRLGTLSSRLDLNNGLPRRDYFSELFTRLLGTFVDSSGDVWSFRWFFEVSLILGVELEILEGVH